MSDVLQCGHSSMHHDDVPVLLPPLCHRAHISIWTDVSAPDMDLLDFLESPDELRTELARIFRLDDHEDNSESAVLLDTYFHAVQFARECCFTKEQTAAFLSILRQTHDACAETPFDNITECFRFFRELVLCHSVHRPPFSIGLFTLDEARRLTEHVTNTYFRHFKLYKYVFTPDVSLDLELCYPNAPLTPEPSELGEVAAPVVEEEKQDEVVTEEPKEEPEELSVLRRLVRQHLAVELEKLKICAEEKLSETNCEMNERLQAAEKSSASDSVGAASPGDKKGKKKDKKKK